MQTWNVRLPLQSTLLTPLHHRYRIAVATLQKRYLKFGQLGLAIFEFSAQHLLPPRQIHALLQGFSSIRRGIALIVGVVACSSSYTGSCLQNTACPVLAMQELLNEKNVESATGSDRYTA